MTSSSDLEQIETRTLSLVRDFSFLHADDPVANSCKAVADAVAQQAVTSSEGGKRLRALLTLDAFRAFAPQDVAERDMDAVLDLACAIEVFQTGALVHDDIIDDSDLRRGKPSAHRALETDTGSPAIGRGLGLMLGDLLATVCIDIGNEAAALLPHATALTSAFLNMQREVEIGQILDLAVEQAPLQDAEALADASLNVFRWKTASYTTIAPIELALLGSGAAPGQARERALAIGKPLGLAFQLEDDLIDVIGSSRATGKPVGGDIREGKRTVLLADAIAHADCAARDELIAMFEASSRSESDVSRAIGLFQSTGAVERSRQRIGALWDESVQAIRECKLEQNHETALLETCARFVPDIAKS